MNTNGSNYQRIGPSQNIPASSGKELDKAKGKEKERESEALGTPAHLARIKEKSDLKNTLYSKVPTVSKKAFNHPEKSSNFILERSQRFAGLVKFWSNVDKRPLAPQEKHPASSYSPIEKKADHRVIPAIKASSVLTDQEKGKEKLPDGGTFSRMPKAREIKLIVETAGNRRFKLINPQVIGEGNFKAAYLGHLKTKNKNTLELGESKTANAVSKIPCVLTIPHARPKHEMDAEMVKEMNDFELRLHQHMAAFIRQNKDNYDCTTLCVGHQVAILKKDGTLPQAGLMTEYKNGGDLKHFEATHKLTEKEKLSISIDVANALFVLHEAGIAHRDIKKDNILIEVNEQGHFAKAYLSDLGGCEWIGQDQNPSNIMPIHMLPPNCLKLVEETSSPKLDDYEFGTFLYFLFCSKTTEEKMVKFLRPAPMELSEFADYRGGCDNWPGFQGIAPKEIQDLIRQLTHTHAIGRMTSDEALYVLEDLKNTL